MIELNLPKYNLTIKHINGETYVFDMLRKRFVRLTREEYVRQHFINYLVTYKGYPRGLMNNEISISLNTVKYRCDTVVFSHDMKPIMILEYKAPSCKIDMSVLKQAYIYNMALKVNYLILSNGLMHYCFFIDYEANDIKRIMEIPDYSDLCRKV